MDNPLAALGSAENFLEELNALGERPLLRHPLDSLVLQQLGTTPEVIIRDRDPSSGERPLVPLPLYTVPLDSELHFDPVEELRHFAAIPFEQILFPLADRMGQIDASIGLQPLDFVLSKPTRDIDLVFDYSSGKVVGVKEVDVGIASFEGSSSMQREMGSAKDFVRGSSNNAPFLPGGLEKVDKRQKSKVGASGVSRAELKKAQKDVTAYASIETSPLFDLEKVSPFLPGTPFGISYDASGVATLLTTEDASSTSSPASAWPTLPKTSTGLNAAGEGANMDDPFAALPEQSDASSNTTELKRDVHAYRDLLRERQDETYAREQHLASLRSVVQANAHVIKAPSSSSSSDAAAAAAAAAESSGSSPSLLDGINTEDGSNQSAFAWLKSAQKAPTAASQLSEWAVTERMTNIMTDFDELVPDPAIIYPFEMDDFQKEAAYHLEQGESVFIAAHTSAGKTVVAEYAIALAMKHMTRAIYTSPIKALSNQKYRDFKDTFGDDVGLITGDVSVHSDATCLIVTTEILRSMLYKGADLIRDVEWVIFDEVHYINDLERGVVWEEVIIMLPDHVGLIFLSATVPNTLEFADWVGRTKKKKVFVIKTDKRPVPLEHYLYYDKQLYKMCDAREGYLPSGHGAVTNAIRDKKDRKEAAKPKKAGASSAMRSKPMSFSSQRGTWSKIIQMLHAKNLLPAVAFVFSKNQCMDLAQSLVHVDLTNKNEKSEIKRFIGESIKRLKGTDRQLPQVLIMTELLTRGIGVHHGGLLPIVKEIVEILFSTSLIKVLFATETFAMGVNMPTRTVLFNSTKKWDGKNKRDLLPGEYIQMSGRAGRRGLDTVGTVIVVVFDEVPESLGLKTMVTGRATKLASQFRLTYNMILNLLKMGGDFKIEDMIKRSFFESSNQKDTALFKERLKLGKRQLRDIEDIVCSKPGLDSPKPAPIVDYYSMIAQERLLMVQIQTWLVKSTYINELLCQGRVLIVNVPGLPKKSMAAVVRTPGTVPMSRATAGSTGQADVKSTSIRVIVLTGSASPALTDKYKVVVVDSASPEIDFITVKKLKRVEAERIDIVPDEVHIAALIKEMDTIRIEALPGLPGVFDPIKNLKIKDMDFVEMNQQLKDVRSVIATSPCHDCDLREEHLGQQEQNTKLREQVTALEFLLSDQNLLMIPEYESRVRVLKHLGFVNQDGIVQVKGRVARELNNCDELIATELIFQNILIDMPADEIVALLSCFVFQEKSDNEPSIPDALKSTQKVLMDLATRLGELQVDLGVPITPQEFVQENVNPGLMECVYEWAHNRPFHEIVRLTDVQEGSIVRTIVRLDETLRDFRSAAKLIGNVDLATKMEEASQLIKRDIVFASSLYIADAPQQRQKSDGSALAADE